VSTEFQVGPANVEVELETLGFDGSKSLTLTSTAMVRPGGLLALRGSLGGGVNEPRLAKGL
jgi:hypothetical protein